MMSGAEYLLLLEKIDLALNSINGYICSRPCCFNNPDKISENPQGYHTYVGISKGIWDGKKFTEKEILNYENDIKHGVVHGILTFVASCIIDDSIQENLHKRIKEKNFCELKRSQKISNSDLEILTLNAKEFAEKEVHIASETYGTPTKEEKLLTSCLVHDFIKCSHGEENHDKKLLDYFPRIDPITLRHSAPSKGDASNPLIKADRLELQRFPNHEEWIDKEKVLNGYSDLQINLIEIFYKKIRPVFEKAYNFRNERWIRHGLEKRVSMYKFKDTYPSDIITLYSKENKDKVFLTEGELNKDYWCIEISKGSNGDCITGQTEPNKDYEGMWQEVYTFFPWELVQGKVPLKEYKNKSGGNIIPSINRDHFFASGNLPIQDWIFTHKNINSRMLDTILEKEIKICHEEIVSSFLKTCEKVMDLFYAIKLK